MAKVAGPTAPWIMNECGMRWPRWGGMKGVKSGKFTFLHRSAHGRGT